MKIAYHDVNFSIDVVMRHLNDVKSTNALIVLADGTTLGGAGTGLTYKEMSGLLGNSVKAVRFARVDCITNSSSPFSAMRAFNPSILDQENLVAARSRSAASVSILDAVARLLGIIAPTATNSEGRTPPNTTHAQPRRITPDGPASSQVAAAPPTLDVSILDVSSDDDSEFERLLEMPHPFSAKTPTSVRSADTTNNRAKPAAKSACKSEPRSSSTSQRASSGLVQKNVKTEVSSTTRVHAQEPPTSTIHPSPALKESITGGNDAGHKPAAVRSFVPSQIKLCGAGNDNNNGGGDDSSELKVGHDDDDDDNNDQELQRVILRSFGVKTSSDDTGFESDDSSSIPGPMLTK